MSSQVITIKIDPITKKKAQDAAEAMGLSLSSVIKGLLKQFIQKKSMTFRATDEVPSEYLINAIKQAEKDYKKRNTSPAFKTGKEMIDWLDKQGV